MNGRVKTMMRGALALALCATLALGTTACFKPTADNPAGTVNDATTEPTETRVTVAVPEGQLDLTALMATVDSNTAWSELSSYTHNVNEDGRAVFAVMNSEGKECTLLVTFDEAQDVVTEALLTYKEHALSVLSDDNTVALRTIMVAMNEEG